MKNQEGAIQSEEIPKRKGTEEQILAEHNLALRLAAARSLDEALPLCLETAIRVSGMDCGGVYVVDRTSGDLLLAHAKGLSSEFIKT